MVTSAVLALAMGKVATSKFQIVAASIFKNGYAVVTRALDVRPGSTFVTDIPNGALGTVWFQTTKGLKIESIRNTFVSSGVVEHPPASVEDMLRFNIGKDVKLGLQKGSVKGKLISISGNALLIQTSKGLLTIHAESVQSVLGNGLTSLMVEVGRSKVRALKITVKGTDSGRLYMIALEHGLSWTPAYSLDITDPAKLHFAMKATLSDDLGSINGIEARLITGYPNVTYANTRDPLLEESDAETYLQSIGATDAQRNALLGHLVVSNQPIIGTANRALFAGGDMALGGGQGFVPRSVASVAYDSAANDTIVSGTNGELRKQQTSGIQAEDLYFYRLADVHLALGDRSYSTLATADLPYKDVYTWEGTDPVVNNTTLNEQSRSQGEDRSDPVWHAIEFENTVGLPLTSAPAITVQGGEILGQDMLRYTSKGEKATVKITKALDVEADSYNEETSLEVNKLNMYGRTAWDLAHLTTTMKCVNRKDKAVHMHVTFPYTGKVEDAGGGSEVQGHKLLHDLNQTGSLEWDKDLEPGQTLVVSFKTSVYVNGHGI